MKFDSWLTHQIKVDSWTIAEISDYIKLKKNQHFATCKLDYRDDKSANFVGLRYVNTQVTYKLLRDDTVSIKPRDKKITRLIEMSEELLNEFSSVFYHDRFSVDKELPPSFSKTIKRAWIKEALEGKNNREIYGYLDSGRKVNAFCIIERSEKKMWRIDLIGVLPTAQGKGLSKKLTSSMLSYCGSDIIVGTQEDNIISNNLYKSYPHEILSRKFVYHGTDFKSLMPKK